MPTVPEKLALTSYLENTFQTDKSKRIIYLVRKQNFPHK